MQLATGRACCCSSKVCSTQAALGWLMGRGRWQLWVGLLAGGLVLHNAACNMTFLLLLITSVFNASSVRLADGERKMAIVGYASIWWVGAAQCSLQHNVLVAVHQECVHRKQR
jgi:hypothetical protein